MGKPTAAPPRNSTTAQRARFVYAAVGRERPDSSQLRFHLRVGGVMGTLGRPANSIRTFAQHAELAYSVAEGATPTPDIEQFSTSWCRSATRYGIDPADGSAPRILTCGELRELREPLGKLIFSAQEEIDRLYKLVREAGYTILFCDTPGREIESPPSHYESSG